MKLLIKYALVLAGLFLSVSKIYGQQEPQYTQYMYNMNIINPAYAGSNGMLNIGILGRTQWVGLAKAPKTFTTSINAPVGKRLGLGLSIIADKIGPTREQNIYTDFSYTIPVSEKGNLAFGLKAGVTFLNVELSKIKTQEDGDPLFADDISKVMPNFGMGLFYHTEKFYIGVSVPNLLKSTHIDRDEYIASEISHSYLTSGYVFDINEKFKLKPSMLLKASVGSPLSLDLSLNALFYNFLELGVSYRDEDSVIGLMNVKLSRIMSIGYSYDYTISELSNVSSGSHELLLLFNISSPKKAIVSPRFF